MRIFRSEYVQDYPAYAFGYTVHAELEADDAPGRAYEAGFLPASSDPALRNRFYMARSVRVPLDRFVPSSENRRVLKKFDGEFAVEILDRETLAHDAAFVPCFLSYFADRHGQGVMSAERLDGILETTLPLRAVRYRKEGSSVAYVLEVADGAFTHYWYCCYSSAYAKTSLGMWLMLDGVRRAKDEGRSFLYLGTAYGEKGRYKMNIAPLSFWDGTDWQEDEKRLKALIATDSERALA
ncbi:MAG TPA: GNAT family N-acetyltransferase [Candidatus Paceibacterota bacterium]|nr:GNAT family N-acetyltransferase [Candidatus Paceibacterota bacterium]